MAQYNIQSESKCIFETLLQDETLALPSSFVEAARKVTFVGDDPKPFIPTPCKITESSSSLTALVAAAASAVARDRYGIDYQEIEVNTDLATLFLESVLLPTVNGKSFLQNPTLQAEFKKGDLYEINKPIHMEATNVYKTSDGRYYHLHGSLNAAATMKMIGVEEQDVTRDEAIQIYTNKVAQFNSEYLEQTANEVYKEAGVTCLTPEEFFASEQGKIMSAEPLWTTRAILAPKTSWPDLPDKDVDRKFKPLAGIRVIDFSRVVAAPVISKLLALLGADVIKVTSSGLPDISILWMDLSTGKRDANIDLKTEEGKNTFASLVAGADVLIDGYRPNALARQGFDSASLRKINSKLIYVRENCYGFKGPLAHRSGWQQISDCLVGISWLQGRFLGLDEPVVPLLRKFQARATKMPIITYANSTANSDYQVGLIGTIAVLKALLERTKSDQTFDIDVSLTQYNIWYYRLGQYDKEQARELLARNEGFHARHYDEMQTLLQKTLQAMQKARPDLFNRPDLYWKMSGKEWGLDDDILILAPAFKFDKTQLEYTVPSGSKGRSKAEW